MLCLFSSIPKQIAAICVLATFSACARVTATPIQYSETTGCFFGFVVDQDGRPLQGAKVEARTGELTFTQLTEKTGRYSFNNLSPGSYKITVHKPGFISVRLNKLIEVIPNTVVHQMFRIRVSTETDGDVWAVQELL